MLAAMPAQVYFGWQRYLVHGTFSERIVDRHLSTLCALFANAWLRRRGQRMFTPDDFSLLPKPEPKQIRQASDDELLGKLIMGMIASGGEIIDKRNASKDTDS